MEKEMKYLQETWRWYGPDDPVNLSDIRQAGATGIVTALHHIPTGKVWPIAEIQKRKAIIEAAGLKWSVVESLSVHEDIKRQSEHYKNFIEAYQQSIRNLAACGIHTITYNFMPVLDATRTDLAFPMPDGSESLYFDLKAFAAFDLYVLKRPGAEVDYSASQKKHAQRWLNSVSKPEIETLSQNIMAGIPGAMTMGYKGLSNLQEAINSYGRIDKDRLRKHLTDFLGEVVPVAEEVGTRLAIHPDDPPFPLLSLPRVMSTQADAQHILDAVPSPKNGLCFCTGSYGVRPDNDLPAMIRAFADRIHFVHLRSTKRDKDGNFFEAAHLEGDVDMYEVMKALLEIQEKRTQSIPMRPDHGHKMLDDLQKEMSPGYSAIGRLRGLAELRGLALGIGRNMF